jgi:hypothetical protein
LREVVEILEADAWRRHTDSATAAWYFAMFNGLAKIGELDNDLEKYLPSDDKSGPVELTPEQAEKLLMLIAKPMPKVD